MKKTLPSLTCPYCEGPCRVKSMECESCQIRVEGDFQANEFISLGADDLHFLRIFLQCEGRIKEMEAPLGLSYPTIRTRLTRLKEKILAPALHPKEPAPSPVQSTLDGLDKGDLTFQETLEQIKKLKGKKK